MIRIVIGLVRCSNPTPPTMPPPASRTAGGKKKSQARAQMHYLIFALV
jgi:hypothetical protein